MPLIIDLNYDIEATAKLLADSFPTKSKVSSIELSQESIINPSEYEKSSRKDNC